MRLLPVGVQEQSDWEDGLWVEKPGYPFVDCSWIHPPRKGCYIPEFEFEEGHDKNKNEPAPSFLVGSGNDCHIRLPDSNLPERICRVFKEGKAWLLEALMPGCEVYLNDRPLNIGQQMVLRNGDTFTLAPPPTSLAYWISFSDEDNLYIDMHSEKEYPNKYPGRFPFRSSLPEAPPAPEELRRLAWQTDQMRRRSEEDNVRVGDWSAFSQYVKRHYYKYGIECIPWCTEGRQRPIDKAAPLFPERAYPSWIKEIVAKERQLPGIDPNRVLPYASCMRASGVQVQPQIGFGSYQKPADHGPMVVANTSTMSLEKVDSGYYPPTLVGGFSDGARSMQPATIVAASVGGAGQNLSGVGEIMAVNPHLRLSFKEWLEGMDDSMFLLQYHDEIAANFDSLEQIHEIYFRNGELKKTFFEDTGIKKLGHRRIFEKWFKDFCR